MTEPLPPSSEPPSSSRLALRLLGALTVFLALGDLVWFVLTFPNYFHWTGQGWTSPAIPLFLLWTFLGLPSLVCGIIAVRLARATGRPGWITSAAFHLVLIICTAVPLLASLAAWTAGPRGFPWLVWLITITISAALWYLTLRAGARPGT
jgi:hypothetical protein